MSYKIKRRIKRKKYESISLGDLLPEEVDIECPYGEKRKATLHGLIEEFDTEEVDYECDCNRGDIRTDCVKTVKVSSLLEKENIVIRVCPPG